MAKIHASARWSEAALQILADETRRILKHEAGTRAGEDPEQLHQMRVGIRRLRSALRLFEPALKLPKPARRRSLSPLAAVLGSVRDLDVQMEMLRERYLGALPEGEQQALERLLAHLESLRTQARSAMLRYLDGLDYEQFKSAYTEFLESPKFRRGADESLYHLLPAFLREALSTLWAHPGWEEPDVETMHDLRIAVKRVRYNLEFFLGCYGKAVRSLHGELKRIQEELGIIHDCDVLLGQLHTEPLGPATPWQQPFSRLTALVRNERRNAVRRFRRLKTRLLSEDMRNSLAVWVSWPGTADDRELFEGNQLPVGALELERRYRLAVGRRTHLEAQLGDSGFRAEPAAQQTDHYLEVLGPHQYLRLRRAEAASRVHFYVTRKDYGPGASRRVEEETVSPLIYRAFLARFHQLPVPVVAVVRTAWNGFWEQVPLSVAFESIEGIGPESGDYATVAALVPDEVLLEAAGACLERFCTSFGLEEIQRQHQSEVSLLLGWVANQQLAPAPTGR
ncbi:CHAD domain-containing protein [Gloeobacter violaceus]|nr:CHAD domain-containing protein [Gloeobacter violaceus]